VVVEPKGTGGLAANGEEGSGGLANGGKSLRCLQSALRLKSALRLSGWEEAGE